MPCVIAQMKVIELRVLSYGTAFMLWRNPIVHRLCSSSCVIVRVRVVLKRTDVGDRGFDNMRQKSSSEISRE